MKRIKFFNPLLMALVFLLACADADKENVETEKFEAEEVDITDTKNVVENLPSPIEMAILIKHAGAEYNMELLNPLKNISNYTTHGKKALNLGVYSADVGYTTLFKQTQETMFYLDNIRKLSDDIGLSTAFDTKMFERVEANIENRDSLLHIITEAYQTSNDYLENNDRMNTSVLMVAGAWIESMYIATQLCGGEELNKEIAHRVSEQGVLLNKLIIALEKYKSDPMVAEVLVQLRELKKVYEQSELATKVGDEITVDKKQLTDVMHKTEEIRKQVIG